MLNDLRGYLQLANGLSDVTKAKAKEIAMELVNQGIALSTKAPDIKGQVQELADDLLSTSRNNREMLLGLVTSEVDRAVSRMGFVREDELAAVRRHVQRLEKEIAELKNATAKPVKKAATKKAATKKSAPAKEAK
jgi:polyhydroxyalkanoate synthesis regulator phasin